MIRRAFKRAVQPDPAVDETPKIPPFLALAVRWGEVRCPMKGSIIGTEACATIQATGANCALYACRFVGHGALFSEEAARMKGPPPEKRPRKKAVTTEVAGDGLEDE